MGDNLRLSSKQASITAGKAYYKKHAMKSIPLLFRGYWNMST